MEDAPRNWMRWDEDEQQGFALAVGISLIGHVLLFGILSFAPGPKPLHAPASISVRLVAALPTPSRGGAAKAVKSVAKPAPAPAPTPVKPVAKKRVLPRDPAPVRAKPKPARRRPKPEELQYEDALASLRAEMGEATPAPAAPDAPEDRAGPVVDDPLATAGEPQAGGGAVVSPELAKWLIATKRHVRSVWITPPDFLNRRLSTELQVRLGPTGEVLGNPVVVRSSGDPYWDDNAIRALMKASPLPAPPEPGVWPFVFSPGE